VNALCCTLDCIAVFLIWKRCYLYKYCNIRGLLVSIHTNYNPFSYYTYLSVTLDFRQITKRYI